MTSLIHPTAIIDATAQLHPSVTVGPYAIIGPQCVIGANSKIGSHVVIESHTTLGTNVAVSSSAVLGGLPQDVRFENEPTRVRIGNDVIIREFVTVHRSTGMSPTGEPNETVVEDGCMLMAYSHVAHNCLVESKATLANNVHLGGHVVVGRNAFIGGMCVIHQFVKVGRLAIIGGFSGSRQDVPPFALSEGRPTVVLHGINTIGLKRNGFNLAERMRIKKAYQLLWFSEMNIQEAIKHIRETFEPDANVDELLAFVQNSKRGIHRPDDNVVFEESAEKSPASAIDARNDFMTGVLS